MREQRSGDGGTHYSAQGLGDRKNQTGLWASSLESDYIHPK